jgi:Arc-like DNA binding domain
MGNKYTLEETKAISVRVPKDLVAYLEKMASEARRSLSSEVVLRLENSKKADK